MELESGAAADVTCCTSTLPQHELTVGLLLGVLVEAAHLAIAVHVRVAVGPARSLHLRSDSPPSLPRRPSHHPRCRSSAVGLRTTRLGWALSANARQFECGRLSHDAQTGCNLKAIIKISLNARILGCES